MNAPRITSLVVVLVVTTWSCSGYVADTSIAPGDTVRVTAPSMDMDESVGTVAALETDTLTVQVEDRADALYVPLADVTKLEVRRGQKSNAGKGALIGLGVGAVVGVTFGFVACAAENGGSVCTNDVGESSPFAFAAATGAYGAVLGTGIGALIGLAARTDRWETVPLDRIRVSLTPHGLGVSASIVF